MPTSPKKPLTPTAAKDRPPHTVSVTVEETIAEIAIGGDGPDALYAAMEVIAKHHLKSVADRALYRFMDLDIELSTRRHDDHNDLKQWLQQHRSHVWNDWQNVQEIGQ